MFSNNAYNRVLTKVSKVTGHNRDRQTDLFHQGDRRGPQKAPQGSALGDVQSEGLSSPKTKILVRTQTLVGTSPGVHDMEPSHRVGGR